MWVKGYDDSFTVNPTRFSLQLGKYLPVPEVNAIKGSDSKNASLECR
jgi:hypothetical protein